VIESFIANDLSIIEIFLVVEVVIGIFFVVDLVIGIFLVVDVVLRIFLVIEEVGGADLISALI
jgi:hypothetical protein